MNAKFGMGLVLLLLAPVASAQVYKCKGASGETVYSQDPCGAGSEPMKLRSNRAASESAGEASNRAAVYRTTGMSDAGIAERNCLQGGTDAHLWAARSAYAGRQPAGRRAGSTIGRRPQCTC